MLSKIQAAIKAHKSQRNDFGKYNYRSMEDINEAAKPILAEYGLALVVSDELVMIGERYYIKATASIKREDGTVLESATGYAREEETKKGMDASQITGSCSSYARKYAANGLFALDDTKDSDATNKHGKDDSPKEPYRPKPVMHDDTGLCGPMPDTTKDQLRDQAANEYAADLCAGIDLCTTMEKLVAWRKDNASKVNALAPVHKTKVSNYWLEIEKILKENDVLM